MVVVERETWETLFHAATFDELGRDFKISNASKVVKLVGFPPDLLSSWMKDIATTTRTGKSACHFWDREFRSVQFCDRGSCKKSGVGCRVRGWVFHTWYAMEQLAGMHLTRQAGADVAYGNIRRRNSTLKIIVPPGTVTETLRKQPNGIVTSEVTFKFSTAKVVVTVDPPSTCRPKLSASHPLSTGAEDADLSRYPHLPPWDCNQREYAQFKFMQSVRDEPEIYSSKLQLPDFEHLQQRAASWTFPEPTLRPPWGKIKYSLAFPVTAKPYQHPRLTKSKAGFATYADHLRVVEAWNAADARRTAREKKLKEEGEYLQKRNERLRLMVVPEGRERLKQNMQYSPSRDPMFNGQDKAAGVKHAMELSEVPAPATNIYQYDAWITNFFGAYRAASSKRRRR
jgi:hypothetical protein